MTITSLRSIKLKVNFTEFHLHRKEKNVFIRIIAAIDSWLCFQMFCHVLLKWYCNSLLLLSRLTRVTKKTAKMSLWIWNWISYRDCRNVSSQWLVTRVAWATGLLMSGKQFHVLIKSTTKNWIRLRVLSCCLKITSPRISWLPASKFWLICSVNKSFILMWVYHLAKWMVVLVTVQIQVKLILI